MTIQMYDLCGADDRRFSPYCWRARMALAHKGLVVETIGTGFTAIADILGGDHKTVPVIVDGDRVVHDSFAIAEYLEETYPDRPTLFGGSGGQAMARVLENWVNASISPLVAGLIVADIVEFLGAEDRAYFVESRESRFGRSLADVQAGREDRVETLRRALHPMRMTLRTQPFMGGEGPLFPDYMLFGTLQWARVASAFPLLAEDDPVAAWFERCLDLYDGLGRNMPAAA